MPQKALVSMNLPISTDGIRHILLGECLLEYQKISPSRTDTCLFPDIFAYNDRNFLSNKPISGQRNKISCQYLKRGLILANYEA